MRALSTFAQTKVKRQMKAGGIFTSHLLGRNAQKKIQSFFSHSTCAYPDESQSWSAKGVERFAPGSRVPTQSSPCQVRPCRRLNTSATRFRGGATDVGTLTWESTPLQRLEFNSSISVAGSLDSVGEHGNIRKYTAATSNKGKYMSASLF